MTNSIPSNLHLERLGNVVPAGYTYRQKCITPRADLSLPNAYLKWYDLYFPETEISAAQRADCRDFVAAEAERLHFEDELGFVILHRAGPWLLLMIMTWRNVNEIWESVYARRADGKESYQLNEFPQTHRGTFCVWELGIVWHERNAWTRFIMSSRDEGAKLAYIDDCISGMI